MMIDRITLLKKKATGKKHLDKYIQELNALTNIPVNSDRLLTLEETYTFISENNELLNKQKHFKSNAFSFYDKEKICDYILDICNAKNGEAILFTMYSEFCGALQLNNLHEFNFNFSFEAEHAGIITLKLKDFSNQLILDFWEENGDKFIEVEARGNEWGSVQIIT